MENNHPRTACSCPCGEVNIINVYDTVTVLSHSCRSMHICICQVIPRMFSCEMLQLIARANGEGGEGGQDSKEKMEKKKKKEEGEEEKNLRRTR